LIRKEVRQSIQRFVGTAETTQFSASLIYLDPLKSGEESLKISGRKLAVFLPFHGSWVRSQC